MGRAGEGGGKAGKEGEGRGKEGTEVSSMYLSTPAFFHRAPHPHFMVLPGVDTLLYPSFTST